MKLPYSFSLAMTPEAFQKLLADMGDRVVPSSPTAGTLNTSDISLKYNFDGKGSVASIVFATHSFGAKVASNATVQTHIENLLKEA